MAAIIKNAGNKRLLASLLSMLGLVSLASFCVSNHVILHLRDDPAVEIALTRYLAGNNRGVRVLHDANRTVPGTVEQPDSSPVMQVQEVQHPVEAPIDNPEPASGYDTFSACLLVMDDNHRLIEWLAYHYHVLPLRFLIVAVDPRSRTSPTYILNRWRRMGVFIEEWSDKDFLKAKLANNVLADDAPFQYKRDRHRNRQKVFYRECLIQMKKANRTYTTLHDTDEYLVYNHAGGDDFEQWEKQQQKLHLESRNKDEERIRPFHIPPTTADDGSMLNYIRKERASGHPFYQSSCVSCPRLHFGAMESTLGEQTRNVPPGFDAGQFDTMRWRKHSRRNDFIKNNLSKVIIDVSQVDVESTPRFRSLHRPISTICRAPWVNEWESGLRINHYLGSWESFSFRDDSRRGGERSRETWEFQAADQDATDDIVRPWLEGFVQTNGKEKANEMLQGIGLPKSYRNTNETAWKYMWLGDILNSSESVGTNPRNHLFDSFVRERYADSDSDSTIDVTTVDDLKVGGAFVQ